MKDGLQDELLSELGRNLVEGSLTDVELLRQTAGPVVQILPEANVVKIGGQSVIDRGGKAVFPLIEEIVENLPRHQIIIGTGAGGANPDTWAVGFTNSPVADILTEGIERNAGGAVPDIVLIDAPDGGTQTTALAAIAHGDIAAVVKAAGDLPDSGEAEFAHGL